MSIIQSPYRPLQQFFRSGPMPCPYVPGRVERKLFTRLSGPQAMEVNSSLSKAGFRRSHDIVYRPVCPGCNACVPVRIPVGLYDPDRAMRRIIRRNADLTIVPRPARGTEEQFRIFNAYQRARHVDSDMSRMSVADFSAMIDEGQVDTYMLEIRGPDDRLYGAVLADRLEDGFSAVYSFFDPAESRRSLGTFLILGLVEAARHYALGYVYLGYWIGESRKMAYKARFRPLEMLGRDGWSLIQGPMPGQTD